MELKKGQKLYQIVYWDISGRKLEHLVIKKVNPKTVTIAWYDNYRLHKDKIGKEWFVSKQDAIRNTLRLYDESMKKNLGKKGYREKEIIKQINSLKSWLRRLEV